MSRTTKKRQVRVQTHGAADLRSVNLFEFLGESMLRKIEDAPIEVRFVFADGEQVVRIEKNHPWFKPLQSRRIAALRQSLQRALVERPKSSDPPDRAPEMESPGDGESTRTKPLAGSERAFANHIAASRAAASNETEGV